MNNNLKKEYIYSDLISMNMIKDKIDSKHSLNTDDVYLLRLIFKHYAELIEKVYYFKK